MPVGTKVVCIGDENKTFSDGEILEVSDNQKEKYPLCDGDKMRNIMMRLSEVALLPQSTMTEQEKWQFPDIDLDACECVEYEGKRYPKVMDSRDKIQYVVICSIGDAFAITTEENVKLVLNAQHKLVTRLRSELTPIPKKQAPTTRPWNQDEVLGLVRKRGVELGDEHGRWVNAVNYQIEQSGMLHVCGWAYNVYTHYRSQETNWESQPLTKVVE